jgi:hypothetical protein
LPSVIISGNSFQSGATCNFGAGITVNSCTFNSATQLTANISISSTATVGPLNVSVTNPDSQSGALTNGFSVTTGAPPPPQGTPAGTYIIKLTAASQSVTHTVQVSLTVN